MENKGKSKPNSSFVVVFFHSLSVIVCVLYSILLCFRTAAHTVRPNVCTYICSFSRICICIWFTWKNEIGSYKLNLVLDGWRLCKIQWFLVNCDVCCCCCCILFFVYLFVSLLFHCTWCLCMIFDCMLERPMQRVRWRERSKEQENEIIKKELLSNVASSLLSLHFRRSLVVWERILSLRFLCTYFFFVFTHIVYTWFILRYIYTYTLIRLHSLVYLVWVFALFFLLFSACMCLLNRSIHSSQCLNCLQFSQAFEINSQFTNARGVNGEFDFKCAKIRNIFIVKIIGEKNSVHFSVCQKDRNYWEKDKRIPEEETNIIIINNNNNSAALWVIESARVPLKIVPILYAFYIWLLACAIVVFSKW